MRRILVTGGAGFIGSHLCEHLLARGDQVTCVDSFTDYYDPAIKERNVAPMLDRPGFKLERSDFRDGERLEACLRDAEIDTIVHLGALAGVRPSIERPVEYADVNVRGTSIVAEAAHAAGVKALVFASSSSVYGESSTVPFREDDPADRPVSPYAATKRAAEMVLAAAHHIHGFPVTCLRYFTVYGPRQRPEMAIHKFARLMEASQPIPMHGDGSSSRDYTFVADAVRGTVGAIDAILQTEAGFRVYNIGGEHPVTLKDLIERIAEALGREPEIHQLPDQPGDVPRTFAEVSRARGDLGYEPQVSLVEGLRRFVAWLRSE